LIGVLRNVEDGVAALNSGGAAVGGSVNGVKDNVAGFVSSTIKDPREGKEAKTSGEGFMYTILKELVCANYVFLKGDASIRSNINYL